MFYYYDRFFDTWQVTWGHPPRVEQYEWMACNECIFLVPGTF